MPTTPSPVAQDVASAEASIKTDVAKVKAVESGLSRTQLAWAFAVVGFVAFPILKFVLGLIF